MEQHRVTADNAARIQQWFEDRGGIALWRSIDLSDPGASWTTPLTDPVGGPPEKPSWKAEAMPSRTITDPSEVLVDVPKLVKRFHIAVRMGRQGLALKLTDASSDRVRREQAKAGAESWYEFDYCTQECLIFVPGATVPLPEWTPGVAECRSPSPSTSVELPPDVPEQSGVDPGDR